jgi:acyl-coenzyme A synthetase/AMP-(fatty) acid ligase
VLNLLPFGSAWSTFHALKCLFLGKPYFGFTYRDKRLLKVISNYPIRTIIGSPVQIKTLVDAMTELKISLPNVESILIGGSSPSKALFREIKSKINCKVFNTYGSTEAGHIAINEIDGEEDIGLLIRPPVESSDCRCKQFRSSKRSGWLN